MLRVPLPALALLCFACSSEPPALLRPYSVEAAGVGRLRLLGLDGDIGIATRDGATIEFAVRGKDKDPLEISRNGADLVVRATGRVDGLEITAPPGLDLHVVAGGAAVTIGGTWGDVNVGTRNGPIAMDAQISGGGVRSTSGRIEAALRRSDLEADFEVRSDSGDLTLRVPASFHGGVQIGGAKGKIDVVPHRRHARMVWDPDETNVMGWVGPVPTLAETQGPDWKDRPSLIARSRTGGVRFEIGGD